MISIDNNTDQKIPEEKLVKLERFASIGRLSIDLIHQLGNPLDGVSRYSRLLLAQMPADDPNRMYVEQIQNGLTRITNMVGELMAFTRTSIPDSGSTDIRKSIERSLFFFSEQISTQNIKVETELDEDISVVASTEMEHVFTNIVKNAVQAMPDGGTLTIKAKMHSPQLFEARFNDTGPGILEELRKRIFIPFFTTKELKQGVGLGLFISQEIVESCDGSIEVESELNKGTTFIVRLPIYKGKILVMDDEKHIRDAVAGMLSSIGYKVITTVDGAKAVELYRQAKDSGSTYDAVILDLTIPGGMDGKEAIQRLLQIDPTVKAIVSSGYRNNPIITDFRKHGFKNSICKPYWIGDLDKVLHEVIAVAD